ncbi:MULTISPECIES: hypothetical protein [Nocardia]|uniref:hypothetical protein n=1 Tax=Nocardia TaxID=1817 RepID=UPI0018944736|nr:MULTISPECIES: hypothetical protein [Nocardia]MBF6174400.1 hypothetical protein [Nocardia blacklockiae]
MFAVGDEVRIRPAGVSVFRVVEIEDDEHVIVEPVDPAPGAYPHSRRVADLILASAV